MSFYVAGARESRSPSSRSMAEEVCLENGTPEVRERGAKVEREKINVSMYHMG